jgi:hypothetical protein
MTERPLMSSCPIKPNCIWAPGNPSNTGDRRGFTDLNAKSELLLIVFEAFYATNFKFIVRG